MEGDPNVWDALAGVAAFAISAVIFFVVGALGSRGDDK